MSRLLVASSDCLAGLPPEQYEAYLYAEYGELFKSAHQMNAELGDDLDPEVSWLSTRKVMTDTLRGLSEDDIAAILGRNAARIDGPGVAALAPIVNRIDPVASDFADLSAEAPSGALAQAAG